MPAATTSECAGPRPGTASARAPCPRRQMRSAADTDRVKTGDPSWRHQRRTEILGTGRVGSGIEVARRERRGGDHPVPQAPAGPALVPQLRHDSRSRCRVDGRVRRAGPSPTTTRNTGVHLCGRPCTGHDRAGGPHPPRARGRRDHAARDRYGHLNSSSTVDVDHHPGSHRDAAHSFHGPKSFGFHSNLPIPIGIVTLCNR